MDLYLLGEYVLEHYQKGDEIYAVWDNKYAIYDPERSSFYLPQNMVFRYKFDDIKVVLLEQFENKLNFYLRHEYQISKIDVIHLPSGKLVMENADLDKVRDYLRNLKKKDLPLNIEFRMVYVTYPPYAMLQPFCLSIAAIKAY